MENGLWDPNFSRSIKLRAIKWRRAVPLVEPLDYLGRVERQIGKAAAISDYHTHMRRCSHHHILLITTHHGDREMTQPE